MVSFPKNRRLAFVTIVSGILSAYAAWLAISRIVYDFAGAHEGDGFIYMGVGRGILNGLLPYKDLFETKPPGMFLISALSAWLFDDLTLGNIMQGLVDIGIVILIMLPVLRLLKDQSGTEKMLWSLGAFGAGVMTMLYAATRGGGFQTESIGAFFVTAYFALVATTRGILSWRKTALASLLLMVAIGLKEPFIVIAIAGSLLLMRDLRTFFWNMIVPTMFALIAGTIVMLLLGHLLPYVELYLPVMLGDHIGVFGSPWVRGLNVMKVLGDLWHFSPPLALLVPGSFVLSCWISAKEQSPWNACLRHLAAAYLAVFTVGLGGEFVGHHFAFAVPLYACLFWICVRGLVSYGPRWASGVGAVLIVAALLMFPQPDYGSLLAASDALKEENRAFATQIDALLDACGPERYLIVGDLPYAPYAYTTHSPLGPGFFQYALNNPIEWRKPDPFFIESFVANLETTPIFLMPAAGGRPIPKPILDYVGRNFTTERPACATQTALPADVTAQYRIGAFTSRP